MPETRAKQSIVYTYTDEAPALATHSLLPIISAFARAGGVEVGLRDISLAGRILAQFPQYVSDAQRVPDALADLGREVGQVDANIIKLPNISASLPQLLAAIDELQKTGFDIPDYPMDPVTAQDRDVRDAYDRVKGSAVNPVLRLGNSDRRAPASVKAYAKAHPHSMGQWSPTSATRVATMTHGDFFHNEESVLIPDADVVEVRLIPASGATPRIIKDDIAVDAGEVLDASFMSVAALRAFVTEQIAAAKKEGLLLSAHLKATMMKVSDPIIFGHIVRAFFPQVFSQYGEVLQAAKINPNDGLGNLLAQVEQLPQRDSIVAAIEQALADGPDLAMVNSDAGITNLHVPSDVIIDASMPAMIRAGGKMWGPDGALHDTLAVIPDSSYAGIYQAAIDNCRQQGALDPAIMGTVPNVGLMAMAAEEYGSHDKTFEVPCDGRVEVVLKSTGEVIISHDVEAGDIWRACQTKDLAIRDWIALAVRRAKLSGMPAVFWLDSKRLHDVNLLLKLEQYLPEQDTDGLDIHVMAPAQACAFTFERMRQGLDTISVTGNVLRDYNTDLFPILELGTSAKMLSIVPLLAGGGLFETGAGGSAPRHVEALLADNYLRWDSLGEFFALAASLEHLALATGNRKAEILASTLDRATGSFLEHDRSPGRRVGSLDTRGSHFYLALYWAQELAHQPHDIQLAALFAPLAAQLEQEEHSIVEQLTVVQGHPVDIGGYYRPDAAQADAVMRPSASLNAALAAFEASLV